MSWNADRARRAVEELRKKNQSDAAKAKRAEKAAKLKRNLRGED